MSPITLIEFAAVAAAAVFGVLRAARQGFDVVGIFFISFVVALGGGTLRDVLLDRHPVFWIKNDQLVWLVLAISLVGAYIPAKFERIERFLWVPDALGLALFSILGATFAIDSGASSVVAVLLGVVTGTFGGVMADVMCRQLPTLFHTSPLYATCSAAGATTYLLADYGFGAGTLPLALGFAVCLGLRIWAVLYDVHLPSRTLRK